MCHQGLGAVLGSFPPGVQSPDSTLLAAGWIPRNPGTQGGRQRGAGKVSVLVYPNTSSGLLEWGGGLRKYLG